MPIRNQSKVYSIMRRKNGQLVSVRRRVLTATIRGKRRQERRAIKPALLRSLARSEKAGFGRLTGTAKSLFKKGSPANRKH